MQKYREFNSMLAIFVFMQASGSISIKFCFQKAFQLTNRRGLKKFIYQKLQQKFFDGGELNYIFCSEETILQINNQYLAHDYYTDIISFEISAPDDVYLVADIYISVDTVRSNAVGLGVRFKDEMLRVIFHGALHLLGFKDKSEDEKASMRVMENSWIDEYCKLVSRQTVSIRNIVL